MPDYSQSPLVRVRDLTKYFPVRKGILSRVVAHVKAVDGVSLDIWPNETVGLVGESGCGKTTAGRSLLRLIEPTSGSIRFAGRELTELKKKDLRELRRNMQIIFQDPYGSLNPRMTVEDIVGEGLKIHGIVKERKEIRQRVQTLLEQVGLQASYADRYPHEFSGGQRQRIGIARAIALEPRFIVCDESVSALDVSVQAQVINLLQDIQDRLKLSYLFIAHDLSVVRHISDRVAVMYLGKIVELTSTEQLFSHPAHPYTQALLSAIPKPDPRSRRDRIVLQGDVPSPVNPPAGCPFHTRCPAAYDKCRKEVPAFEEIASGHSVACHLYREPSRNHLSLSEAQADVARIVRSRARRGSLLTLNQEASGSDYRDELIGSVVDAAREASDAFVAVQKPVAPEPITDSGAIAAKMSDAPDEPTES